ncbi:MAG: hypothetical protein KDC88_02360 [Ignavibacteriae bacterium]|nr:hypothetical protein [Ignavibacteriota bacterium]MCB9206141.1 hypothetical protein [Ignavibacteriales bacterium]MCB9209414.1 hypothetical protein [Ignavibacteriales bacterium]MCB9258057.1 hypothetical protein [Ignavibacteriales bacterium]
MEKIDKNMELINNYLGLISKEVGTINNNNLEIKLKNVDSYVKHLERIKKELKESTSKQYYAYICDVLHKGVKQISGEFDSIIERKKEEQNQITLELSKIGNEKKLINYQR